MHDVIAGQPRLNWCFSEAAIYKALQKKAAIAVAQYKHLMKSPVEVAILFLIVEEYNDSDFARATGVRILRNMKVHNQVSRKN